MDVWPLHAYVAVQRIVLVSAAEHHLPGNLLIYGIPFGGSLVLVGYGSQGRRYGARSAPGLHEHGARLVIEKHLLYQLRTFGVIAVVSLEVDVADLGHRLDVFGGRIAGIVDSEIGVCLLVGRDEIVHEVVIPAPLGLGAEMDIAPVILGSGDELGRALAIALPMELAAGKDYALDVEVGGEKQEAYHGVVVVELRIAGDYHPRLLVLDLYRGLLSAGRQHAGGRSGKKQCSYDSLHGLNIMLFYLKSKGTNSER